jgi:hypothetical protein
MGNVIRLPGDMHNDVQLLLLWYVTGRLDAAEQARVASHLETCARCRADLKRERGLGAQVGSLPLEVEHGWQAISHLVGRDSRRVSTSRWPGWAVAAGLAALVLFASVGPRQAEPQLYHALGRAPANPAANVIVVFRPNSTEADIAGALRASGARLVDGPTPAEAYVLHVPPAERAQALETLRSRPSVVMAEPIGDRS